MELKEIVLKLTGPIHPVGDASRDKERFENLQKLYELVGELILEIEEVALRNKDSHEHSVKQAGEYAEKMLRTIKANLIV